MIPAVSSTPPYEQQYYPPPSTMIPAVSSTQPSPYDQQSYYSPSPYQQDYGNGNYYNSYHNPYTSYTPSPYPQQQQQGYWQQQQNNGSNTNKQFNPRYNKKKNFKGGRKKIVKEEIPEHIKNKVLEITNMTTPEAIDLYIEERSKKFPTKKNIEQKDKERQLRVERGELIDIPSNQGGNKRKRKNEDQENNRNKKRFRKICKYWRQGRCNAGENCKFIHDYVPSRPATEEILLKKLLSKNIEYENQAILQCIHFILSNNFLQPKTQETTNNQEENEEIKISETNNEENTKMEEEGNLKIEKPAIEEIKI